MNIHQPVISGSLTVTGSSTFIGNLTIQSGSITLSSGSLSGTSSLAVNAYTASYALPLTQSLIVSGSFTAFNGVYSSNNYVGPYQDGIVMDYVTGNGRLSVGTADGFTFYNGGPSGSSLVAISTTGAVSASQYTGSSALFTGAITAQTLVVSTISSSVEYSSGSNIFGNSTANTQTFTGSMQVTGSATFIGVVSIGTSSLSYPLTINANTTQTSIGLMSGYSNANARNWGIATNALAYGDLNIAQSNALGGDPFAAGTSRIYIAQSGNVGIRTTSPTVALQINGQSTFEPMVPGAATGSLAINSANGLYGLYIASRSNGDTWMQVGRNDGSATAYNLLLQVNGGYVGIGTTSPSDKLNVVVASNGNAIRLDGPTSGLIVQTNASSADIISYGGTTAAYRNMNFAAGSSTNMTITTGGNVGIGTTSPSGIFEVVGNTVDTNFGFFSTTAATNRMILAARNTGNNAEIDIRAHGSSYSETILGNSMTNAVGVVGAPQSGAAMVIGPTVSSPLVLGTNNAERMRITSGGNVLIGETSVIGSGLLEIAGNSTTYNMLSIKDTGTASSGVYFAAFWNSSNGLSGGIQHNTTSTVNYYTGPSDQRLKSNIQDWTQPVLPLFSEAKPKTYNHIADEDETIVYKGFLAQDMVDKFPEAYGLDRDGYYTFNPSGYVPYLVKAIQEQQAQIEELKAQINK